ncbi:hypothetical protein Droror1_Dr00017384, partial [Drosera rotundifolia]
MDRCLSRYIRAVGSRFMFSASDGKMKVKGMLGSSYSDMVSSRVIQNLCLIRVLDYTLNDIPSKLEKYLIVTKCEAVSPALEAEVKNEVKDEGCGIVLKPKKTLVVCLWNDLAKPVGQELLDIADRSPVIAIKSLKVGDFS